MCGGRCLAVAALICAAAATRAAAQGSSAVVAGCQNAAANKMHVARPESDSIAFGPKPEISAKPDSATGVKGTGRFYDTMRRVWRPFSYDCTYTPALNRGEGHVRTDSSSGRR